MSAQTNMGPLHGFGHPQENPQGQAPRIPIIPVGQHQQEAAQSQHGDAHPNPPPKEADSILVERIRRLEEALRATRGPSAYTLPSFANLCFFPVFNSQ